MAKSYSLKLKCLDDGFLLLLLQTCRIFSSVDAFFLL